MIKLLHKIRNVVAFCERLGTKYSRLFRNRFCSITINVLNRSVFNKHIAHFLLRWSSKLAPFRRNHSASAKNTNPFEQAGVESKGSRAVITRGDCTMIKRLSFFRTHRPTPQMFPHLSRCESIKKPSFSHSHLIIPAFNRNYFIARSRTGGGIKMKIRGGKLSPFSLEKKSTFIQHFIITFGYIIRLKFHL